MNSSQHELTALLLCGGKGERLRPLTDLLPKPLVEINQRPILSYLVSHIQSYQIKKLVVMAGYLSEKIFQYFANNHPELDIKIIDSGDVDIIQRIKDAAPYIDKDFILFYGDTLADVNLNELITFHRSHTRKVSVTLWPMQSHFGVMEMDTNNTVCTYKEKPVLDKWINIGYIYFENDVMQEMKGFNRFQDFLSYLVDGRKMQGFKHHGMHLTINNLHELEEAKKLIDLFNNSILGHNREEKRSLSAWY